MTALRNRTCNITLSTPSTSLVNTMSRQPNASLLEVAMVENNHRELSSYSYGERFYANPCMVDCAMFRKTQPTGKTVKDLWNILLSEVRTQLRASDYNTRHYRAYELQLLASSEAVDIHEDVPEEYPIDLVTFSHPMHDAAVSYSVSSFVPISPMRSSRFTTPSTTTTSLPLKSNLTARNRMKSSPILFVQPCASHIPTNAHDQSTIPAEEYNDTSGSTSDFNLGFSGAASKSILPSKNKGGHKPRKPAKKTQKRKTAEPKPTTIARPSKYDVLSGRGGATNHHEGNVWFRNEARKLRRFYRDSNATRDEKMHLSLLTNDLPYYDDNMIQELVKTVKDNGGRFLAKQDDSKLYYEMEDDDARKKALQALRENKWD